MVVVQWRALSSSSSSRQPIIRRQNPRELQLHQVGANPLRTRYDLSVRPSVANKRKNTETSKKTQGRCRKSAEKRLCRARVFGFGATTVGGLGAESSECLGQRILRVYIGAKFHDSRLAQLDLVRFVGMGSVCNFYGT